MNERKYIGEIEGLMVEILYEYEEGDRGDEFTPPTGDKVTIVSWGLLNGEKRVRYEYYDCDDDEWEEWMQDIDHYVHNDAEWDIIEFEHKL